MRVAVTGIASDFGTVIAPLLFADDDVEEVVGIDLRDPRVERSEASFEREDVRSQRMRELFEGCEAVVHLAFVVAGDPRQGADALDQPRRLARTCIERRVEAGVKRLVIASSIASYGVHPDHPMPITEDEFPRGNPDKYYFYDKAEVEHYIEWWERRNPDAGMVITRIRPPFIVGPHFLNPAIDRFCAPLDRRSRPASVPGIQLAVGGRSRAGLLSRGQAATRRARSTSGPRTGSSSDEFAAAARAAPRASCPVEVAAPLAEVLFRLRAVAGLLALGDRRRGGRLRRPGSASSSAGRRASRARRRRA